MSETSFLLTERPWIPVRTREGQYCELSSLDALARAHELRTIEDSSPLVTAVLHRHLLAILHRCFGPASIARWCELYDAGQFDARQIEVYLRRWRHRLDLFHPETPFGQARGLPFDLEEPATGLVTHRTNWGGGVQLFEHRASDADETLSPAEAARWLLATHAFAAGGLIKKPGEPTSATAAPLSRIAVVLVEGRSLFETLLINLLVCDGAKDIPVAATDHDAPSWERSPPPRRLSPGTEPKAVPDGWLHLLTWQSRRIELAQKDGRVVGLARCVYQGIAGELRDPMAAYKIHTQRGIVPLSISEERALWRDVDALLLASHPEHAGLCPKAVQQLARPELQRRVPGDARWRLRVYGMAGDQARILLTRSEDIGVTAERLASPDTREAVRSALSQAEAASRALRQATWRLARHMLSAGDRDPDKADVTRLTNTIATGPHYWADVGGRFDRYLDALGSGQDLTLATEAFSRDAVRAARQCFEQAVKAMGTSARALKAGALAIDTLQRELTAAAQSH